MGPVSTASAAAAGDAAAEVAAAASTSAGEAQSRLSNGSHEPMDAPATSGSGPTATRTSAFAAGHARRGSGVRKRSDEEKKLMQMPNPLMQAELELASTSWAEPQKQDGPAGSGSDGAVIQTVERTYSESIYNVNPLNPVAIEDAELYDHLERLPKSVQKKLQRQMSRQVGWWWWTLGWVRMRRRGSSYITHNPVFAELRPEGVHPGPSPADLIPAACSASLSIALSVFVLVMARNMWNGAG